MILRSSVAQADNDWHFPWRGSDAEAVCGAATRSADGTVTHERHEFTREEFFATYRERHRAGAGRGQHARGQRAAQ